MVSDEAVEAAHEQLDAMGAYVSRKYVRAALEAAAPHMFAEVEKLAERLERSNQCEDREIAEDLRIAITPYL